MKNDLTLLNKEKGIYSTADENIIDMIKLIFTQQNKITKTNIQGL